MSHFDRFRLEVSKLADVTTIIRDTNGLEARSYGTKALFGQIEIEPLNIVCQSYDFVICDAFFAYAHQSWSQIKVPKAVIVEDLHGPVVRKQLELIRFYGADIVFHRYRGNSVKQWMRFRDDFK